MKVLVVDDSDDFCVIISTLLAQRGHDVRIANSGVDAFNVLIDFGPDVIILDLLMPDMNGWEFIDKIDINVPIIVLSGYTNVLEPLSSQVVSILKKPIEVESVIEAIENIKHSTNGAT
jgi:CheY-like chemotaxis protein